MKLFKKVIPVILAIVCVLSVSLFAACGDGKDYSEDIAKLQEQIDKLKDQTENLKNENQNLKDTVSEQDEQIKNQQTLIENLQNNITTEPKIYKVGETFTYSYLGIKYFSFSFNFNSQKTHLLFELDNYNLTGAALDSFIIVRLLFDNGNPPFVRKIYESDSEISIALTGGGNTSNFRIPLTE